MKIEREELASGQVVHRLIAETARAICNEVFEVCSSNDAFHKAWPTKSRKRFVQRYWADYIGHARASLTAMLQPIPGTSEYATHETLRNEIFEALLIDGQYKRPAPISTDQLRANAGFDPISEVMKSRAGAVVH